MNLKKAADVIVTKCLKIKEDERVLILTDSKRIGIGDVLLDSSTELAKYSKLLEKEIGDHDGEEPSKEIAKEMLNYNVIIAPTTYSISHTKARRDASKRGIRIATMPSITNDIMNRCIDIDYKNMTRLINLVQGVISNGSKMRITTALGTDLSFTIKYREIFRDDGILINKGDFGNLPAGEVHFSPLEGSADGIYIVDGSQAGLGKVSRLKFTVEKGFVKNIEGKDCYRLTKLLNSVKDKNAYGIAECGIGMNEKAIITGNILEDEKVKGTCHIALGNNKSYGGKFNVPIHLDGIIRNPSIFVDNKEIIREGKFKL